MGLFRKLGRQAEQFKTKMADAANENSVSRCEACDTRFSEQYEQCPECGSKTITQETTQE